MLLEKDIQFIKGVGEKRAQFFSKLGIKTLYDLISFFPRAYEDRTSVVKIRDAVIDENQSIVATITSNIRISKTKRKTDLIKFTVSDETASMPVIFFNNKYIADKLKKGETYLFYGKITGNITSYKMINPSVEPVISENPKGDILPVYKLTKGLSQDIIRKVVKGSIIAINEFDETLPKEIINKFDLISKQEAFLNIHFPKSIEFLEKARKRLSFEELLTLQLGMFLLKSRNREKTSYKNTFSDLSKFYDSLPFTPTDAQKRCINEAVSDMKKDYSMNRLIQGDVGSGKTLVAAALCYLTVKNNYQCALMVPTEILAKQHFDYFKETLSKFNINVDILTSSTSKKDKDSIKERLKNGNINLIIGTHSLISDDIEFKNLSLVITDEQHRFGVWQRANLADKSENPHVLVMSATPIPRTLALIMYGDLDISVIDQLPPGRQKVDTFFVNNKYRNRINKFIRTHIKNKNQVYIVCPLVDENDNEDLKAAATYAENLQKIFPDYNIGLIHGKLKTSEKDKIMNLFSQNKIQILVSTTVIEVGVNVPNATLMIVENAERFGLSQLHQLRGRVGRGNSKSYCILISDAKNPLTQKRLKIMAKENDGFKISQQDLALRGPGDFFGSKQHGLPPLKISDISSDMVTLKQAQDTASYIINNNLLSTNKLKPLKNSINFMFNGIENEKTNIFN